MAHVRKTYLLPRILMGWVKFCGFIGCWKLFFWLCCVGLSFDWIRRPASKVRLVFIFVRIDVFFMSFRIYCAIYGRYKRMATFHFILTIVSPLVSAINLAILWIKWVWKSKESRLFSTLLSFHLSFLLDFNFLIVLVDHFLLPSLKIFSPSLSCALVIIIKVFLINFIDLIDLVKQRLNEVYSALVVDVL